MFLNCSRALSLQHYPTVPGSSPWYPLPHSETVPGSISSCSLTVLGSATLCFPSWSRMFSLILFWSSMILSLTFVQDPRMHYDVPNCSRIRYDVPQLYYDPVWWSNDCRILSFGLNEPDVAGGVCKAPGGGPGSCRHIQHCLKVISSTALKGLSNEIYSAEMS
jgi:hypothetical protein